MTERLRRHRRGRSFYFCVLGIGSSCYCNYKSVTSFFIVRFDQGRANLKDYNTIMETRQKRPVFFSKLFFDFLKINECQRATICSKIEYLNLPRTEVERRNLSFKIMREGTFLDIFQYIEFYHEDTTLLCVFSNDKRCCRAYSLNNILIN